MTFKRSTPRACALPVAAMLLLLLASAARAQVAAGDAAVAPFVNEQTDAVLALDVSAVNMDQITKWAEQQIRASGVQKATQDKMVAEMNNPDDAKTREWLTNFAKAGGKRMYVVVSFAGVLTGQPGVVVAPVEAGGNAEAIAKILDPNFGKAPAAGAGAGAAAREEEEEAAPTNAATAVVIGSNVVLGPKKVVEAMKAGGVAAAPGAGAQRFAAALAGGGNATLRVAISGSKLAGMPLPVDPNDAQAIQGVEWISLSASAPPTHQARLTVQAKDAAAAKAVADLFTKGLGALQNNPDAAQALGDTKPLVRALTPQAAGNQVTITLDGRTIDTVLMPAMIKANVKRMEDRSAGDDDAAAPAPPAGRRPAAPQPGL